MIGAIEALDKHGNVVHTFASVRDVVAAGFDRTAVYNVIAGRSASHRKLVWRVTATPDAPETRPVEAFDWLDVVIHRFASPAHAATKGFSQIAVYHALAGRQRTHKNLYWRYASDIARPSQPTSPKPAEFVRQRYTLDEGATIPLRRVWGDFINVSRDHHHWALRQFARDLVAGGFKVPMLGKTAVVCGVREG